MGCFNPEKPPVPDYAAANREAVQANAEVLPFQRLINAASAMGTSVTTENPFTGEEATYDFTGYGDADIEGALASQAAGMLLELQQQYGTDYVEQRLKELEAADPEGTQARHDLYGEIMQDLNRETERPVAEELERQILADLKGGGALDEQTRREVQQATRAGQVSRGNVLGTAPLAAEAMEVGQAAQNRRAQRQQQALQYLGAGVSPEDTEYRRTQQQLGNLGSFINGTTPQAQFQSLSTAQQGASPYFTPQSHGATDPNAGQSGVNWRLGRYQQELDWAGDYVNPWVAGISLANETVSSIASVVGAAAASDARLKESIEAISPKDAYEGLRSLTGYTYRWKLDGSMDAGVLAQEVEEVFPFLVIEEAGIKKVKYQGLMALMIQALKYQAEKG